MRPDTAKDDTLDMGRSLLLFNFERTWRLREIHHDRSPLGGICEAEKQPGIYETLPSDPSKKIILNSDNDDRRRWLEDCRPKSKPVCNSIIDWTYADVWDYIRSEH